jgi:serine/threonine-protein kinase RIO1
MTSKRLKVLPGNETRGERGAREYRRVVAWLKKEVSKLRRTDKKAISCAQVVATSHICC